MSTIKEMTGNDKMSVRSLYGKPAEFTITGLLNVQVNENMTLSEYNDAVESRTRIIEYPYQFRSEAQFDPENPTHRRMNNTLKSKFKDDPRYRGEFILILLEINRRLGDGIWNIKTPDAVKVYTKNMILENMEATDWIEKYLVRDADSKMERTLLWEYYQETEDFPLKKQEFFKQIRLSGFKEFKSSKMFFKGMRKNDMYVSW